MLNLNPGDHCCLVNLQVLVVPTVTDLTTCMVDLEDMGMDNLVDKWESRRLSGKLRYVDICY